MRDTTLVTEIKKIWAAVYSIAEGLKIVTLSQACRDKAVESLLIKKGIVTREEIEEEVKREATSMVEEAQKQAATASLQTPTTSSGIVLASASDMPPVPKI